MNQHQTVFEDAAKQLILPCCVNPSLCKTPVGRLLARHVVRLTFGEADGEIIVRESFSEEDHNVFDLGQDLLSHPGFLCREQAIRTFTDIESWARGRRQVVEMFGDITLAQRCRAWRWPGPLDLHVVTPEIAASFFDFCAKELHAEGCEIVIIAGNLYMDLLEPYFDTAEAEALNKEWRNAVAELESIAGGAE